MRGCLLCLFVQGACDLPAGPYPTFSPKTNIPVVQAYYSSKYLGLIKINLRTRKLVPGVQPLLLGGANSSNHVQQDPELLEILDKYRAPVQKLQTQVAGERRLAGVGDTPILLPQNLGEQPVLKPWCKDCRGRVKLPWKVAMHCMVLGRAQQHGFQPARL